VSHSQLILTLQHYDDSHVGLECWGSLFKYIRSHWLIPYLQFDPKTVSITLRIMDGLWYHTYHDAGLIGVGFDELKSYPSLWIGKYIAASARKALEVVGWPSVAVAWRIQRQYCPEWNDKKKVREISKLVKYRERGGFVAGCMTDHLIRQLANFEKSSMVLMLDIYASSGYGADNGADIGPTQNLRRDIVRSIKGHVKTVIVLSHVQAKTQTLLNSVDPMNIHNQYREMFLTWLEIAVGVVVPHFVNAGGHFADAITILRDNKEVTIVPEALHCLNNYYDNVKDEKTDDDILDEINRESSK